MVTETFTIPRDDIGPEMVVEVYDPATGMRGILVVDNTVLGPGKGGIRMTHDITGEEVFRLARAMTFKNALADIPFGGAKSGMVWMGGSDAKKKQQVQAFARALKPLVPWRYVAGPDVNSGEREMKWFVEANGNWRSATGKPADYCMQTFGGSGKHLRKSPLLGSRGKCGLPHEFGSTGFGVAHATAVATKLVGIDLAGATVSIHGFGNVGTFTYQFLTGMGARVIAIADQKGAVIAERGFNAAQMKAIIKGRKSITTYRGGTKINDKQFWSAPVDILIPASVTDVINESNKKSIKVKVIVEAGNIPMRERVEEEFVRRGTLVVPDFVANAGGVISSYAEYRGYNPKRMFDLIERKICKSTYAVMSKSVATGRNPRRIALKIALEKIEKKKREGRRR